jgi:hypothetical protein
MMPVESVAAPLQDQHWMEERLGWFMELTEEMVGQYMELLTTAKGRPAFTEELTPQEQIANFMDPAKRQMIEQRAAMVGGDEAVQRYRAEMLKLIQSPRLAGPSPGVLR